jgi:hypothetical protein
LLSNFQSLFWPTSSPDVDFSIVVVAYDMARELPRTLHSLSRSYQRDLGELCYEVIVVDNGSPQPVITGSVTEHGEEFRLLRIDAASTSPGPAINQGAALARGKYLCLIIDGARVLSPGVLHWATQAFRLHAGAVVAVPGLHLGPEHQRLSSQRGYNQELEDKLLQQIDWPGDGYRLFEIASLAGSARFGWHGPLAESNCIFLSRALFDHCGGCDDNFQSAGGGLVNLDFYQRVCAAADYQVYHLAGEACFHQIHGGVTTGGAQAKALKFNDLQAEYRSLRGENFEYHDYQPILLGSTPGAALPLIAQGLDELIREYGLAEKPRQHLQQAGLEYPFEAQEQ